MFRRRTEENSEPASRDILMLLSVLENGIASSKRCAEEAVAVLEKNLIPVSEDYFPSLRKVSA